MISNITQMPISFMSFNTTEDLNNYISGATYGTSESNPEICFGFHLDQLGPTTFNYSLHYWDSILKNATQFIPNSLTPALDPFQVGPDPNSYEMWLNSGYIYMMKIINDGILFLNTGDKNANIDIGMMTEMYSSFTLDPFGSFIGFLLPFFIVIAFLCPLCVLVFRMVSEKESRAKEGMKIMGLKESIYFLSFFLQWIITNTLYSIINSLILTRVFKHVEFIFIFGFFWLYGMCVYALAFFFSSYDG